MNEPIQSLVSAEWLAANMHADDIVILDASHHLPAAGRAALAEFEAAHIPGARFLDLASLTDAASQVPQALPSPAQLAERLASLGVASGDRIVLYDDSAVKTSARAWIILIAHGIDNVAILDGGLAKWREGDRAMESGASNIAPAEPVHLPGPRGIRSKTDMLANLDSCTEQVVDARGADRVFGTGTDPVHGGANGRIPGSLNLPFGEVFSSDGSFKSPDELRAVFSSAGIDMSQPVTTSCGSGITASVLVFALHLAGHHDVALYDGSWLEWCSDPATPKQQGPL